MPEPTKMPKDDELLWGKFSKLMAGLDGGYAFLRPRLTDTEVVVLASALADESLKFALLMACSRKAVSKTVVENVFEGTAPLASFSARISVCAVLGIIEGEIKHDLTVIKGIRNDFAHATTLQSLSDYPSCLSLKLGDDDDIRTNKHRRRFVSSATAIISSMKEINARSLVERAVARRHKDEVDLVVRNLLMTPIRDLQGLSAMLEQQGSRPAPGRTEKGR